MVWVGVQVGLGLDKILYCQLIASQSQANDHAFRNGGNVRMMAEGFPLVDVRDMDLYNRRLDSGDGVGQGDAGVGISPCIEDNPVVGKAYFVELINQLAFVIALEVVDFYIGIHEQAAKVQQKILEGIFAVDARFPTAQQI